MHALLPFLFAFDFALSEGFPSRSSPVPPESSQESVPALACLGLKCAFLQYFPSLHSPLEKNLHAGGCVYAQSFALFGQVPFSNLKHLRLRLPLGEFDLSRGLGGGDFGFPFFPFPFPLPFGELLRLWGSCL